MKVNEAGDRTRAVSVQDGNCPALFVWNTSSGAKIQSFDLPKNAKAASAVAISTDGALIAVAYRSDVFNVSVFEVETAQLVHSWRVSSETINDLAFHKADAN